MHKVFSKGILVIGFILGLTLALMGCSSDNVVKDNIDNINSTEIARCA